MGLCFMEKMLNQEKENGYMFSCYDLKEKQEECKAQIDSERPSCYDTAVFGWSKDIRGAWFISRTAEVRAD